MIKYSEFEEMANKYSLYIYNSDCYISDNFFVDDELMEYYYTGGFVKFYPKITLYEGNIEVIQDMSYDIHTLKGLEKALENFARECKELKIQHKKELIENDFK